MEFNVGLILALALIIDALSGEPQWLYRRISHPVVVMAKYLNAGERLFNKPDWPPIYRRLGGVLVIFAGVILVGLIGVIIEEFLYGSIPGELFLVLLVSTLLAGRSLFDHVKRVADAINNHDGLNEARQAVGMIIGRRTDALDEPALTRAAIESLSENFSDGVVAPAFWYLIGGLPGILIFKLVNTADSMIGNRSRQYEAFGWAAARLDDVMNIIPARVTAVLIALAAIPFGKPGIALKTAWRDAGKHLSPNAGWPEAAMAGALEIRLGGPRQYPGDIIVEGAWLGNGGETNPDHLARGLKIAVTCWVIMAGTIAVWSIQ
ncbi:MAG: cobalamin biosynthesis protein CobD [Rhodospirillales bacterium]|nr:cobalamin biosynthesis protein CobD [Rhodospirillales bacterium]